MTDLRRVTVSVRTASPQGPREIEELRGELKKLTHELERLRDEIRRDRDAEPKRP